jgi:hypothetical protein
MMADTIDSPLKLLVFFKTTDCQKLKVSGVSPAAGLKTASLNGKEASEHRTSNVERPTSNNVFCQFKKL